MTRPAITVTRTRVTRAELGGALIAPSLEAARTAGLQGADGAPWYLPAYAGVTQGGGGADAFRSALAPDGTLTLFLDAEPPPNLSGTPNVAGTRFGLVLDASGGSAALPLAATPAGGTLRRLQATLSGSNLARARDALFDTIPNVAVEITQTVALAVQQSEAFITGNWEDPAIQNGLLDAFGGIPVETAEAFLPMAIAAAPSFTQEYMVLDATFRWTIPAPPLPGYVRWQVEWNGRAYNYYQDNVDRARVFYLPDGFVLAENPIGKPAVSLLQFSPSNDAKSVADTEATFRFYGLPVVNFERINNAAQALQAKLGETPSLVSIRDAHGVTAQFTLDLPNAQATGGGPVVQTGASIDLGAGLRNEVHLNFTQFRALWAAIFSAEPETTWFHGFVDVTLLGGKYTERLDFDGRMHGDQEAGYFDGILDLSTDQPYETVFTFKTRPEVFTGAPEIVEIAALFAGKTATLDASHVETEAHVPRSLRDIILGRQPPDSYPYTLRVTHADGSALCCARTARSDSPTVWLLTLQIADCKEPCG